MSIVITPHAQAETTESKSMPESPSTGKARPTENDAKGATGSNCAKERGKNRGGRPAKLTVEALKAELHRIGFFFEPPTQKELAEKFKCSTRTIRTYMQKLGY